MFDRKVGIFILCAFVYKASAGNQPNGSYDFSEEKLVKIMKECQAETKASDDDMIYLVTDRVPETKTQSCLVACFGIKAELMYENGTAIIPVFMNITAQTKTPPPSMTKDELLKKTNKVLVFCNQDVKVPDTKENKEKCEAFRVYFVCFDKKAKQIGLPLDQ